MTNKKQSTTNSLNGKTLKATSLPFYFQEHAEKCKCHKNERKPLEVLNSQCLSGIHNSFKYYVCIGSVETGFIKKH